MADDQPTIDLGAGGDSCPACHAPLAPDQRYCLECGQRRATERSPFAAAATAPAASSVAPAGAGRQPRRRVSVNGTFIAGIGTLLLALGVGVMIGKTNNSAGATRSAPAVQVVTVAGAGGAAAATASTGSTGTTAKANTSTAGAAAPSAAATSASDTTLKAGKSTPAVKVGGKCPPGQVGGCQNGKFTGNFFGQ